MLLDEANLLKKAQIYATDINPFVVAEAKNGLYSKEHLNVDQQNYHVSGGTKHFLNYFDQTLTCLRSNHFCEKNLIFST